MTDIVFIHGLFMTPRSWDGWVSWFSERGYRCHVFGPMTTAASGLADRTR